MLKAPAKKDNKYISQVKKSVKISITDVKIKGIKKLINGKGYSISLYISEETNNDTINELITFDNNIINEIKNQSPNWFGKSFSDNEVNELYTKSFCTQTKTINVIITNKEFSNIIYNNKPINDVDTIISLLKENNKYKKCIINLTIEYFGLYFYSEYTSNKWIIKTLDITDLNNDNTEWFSIDDVIDNIEDRITRANKIAMNKTQQYLTKIEEFKCDYNIIKEKFENVKESDSKDLNILLNNIDKILILYEEKINKKM
tara:strand:+ start:2546 stop:3322 length:777 start_codon:yes stop_codon:yes gene_type:complete